MANAQVDKSLARRRWLCFIEAMPTRILPCRSTVSAPLAGRAARGNDLNNNVSLTLGAGV